MSPQASIPQKIPKHDCDRSAGFALVIALGLMAFVLLLLLTITSLVRVEQSSAETSLRQLEAEQNALLGLQVALGELQLTLGPDQRISATAGILDQASSAPVPSQRHLTGVWSSQPAGETVTLRGQSYQSGDRIQWLVSGAGTNAAYHQTAVDPDAPDSVLLVGAGSLGSLGDPANDRVAVALDSIGEDGGQYGWWVGDEGVKARLNLADSSQQTGLSGNQSKQSSILIFGSSSRSDLSTLAGLEPVDLQAGGLAEKIIGLNDLSMDASVSSDDVKQHFHALTVDSMGVLADTKNGGLKQDLSLAFELDDTAFNTSVFGSGGPDTINSPGFGEVQPIFRLPNTTGIDANGPSWHLLRDYYGIYKRIENPMTDPVFKAQAFRPNNFELGDVDMWYELAALRYMDRIGNAEQGDPLRATGGIADKGTNPGVRKGALAIPVKANYLPYVQRHLMTIALEFYKTAKPNVGPYEFHNVKLLINPAFVVHNPYNVKVEHEGLGSYNRSLAFMIRIESLVDNNPRRKNAGPGVHMLKTRGDTLEPGEIKIYEGISMPAGSGDYSEEGPPEDFWTFPDFRDGSFELPYDPDGSGPNVRVFYQPFSNIRWAYWLFHAISIAGIDDPISDLIHGGRDLEGGGKTYSNYGGFHADNIYLEFADWYGGEDTNGREIRSGNYLSGAAPYPFVNFDLLLKPAERDNVINRFPYPSLSHTNPLAPIMDMRNLFPVGVRESNPDYGWPVFSPNWQLNVYNTTGDGLVPGMDFLQSSGTSGYWGTSNTSGGQTSVAMIELPTSPALGLGQLQHANISLFNNMPAFVVGNSFANPYIPRNEVYEIFKNPADQDRIYYDISYLTNEVLWDRYFFSSYSLPYDGGNDEYSGTAGDSFDIAFDPDSYSGDSPFETLPNPRMRLHLGEGENTEAVKAKLFNDAGEPLPGAYARAAENLMVAGSFNVNSTSVEAWKTLLASTRNLSIYRSGQTGEENYGKGADSTPFPRLQQPTESAFENSSYDAGEAWGGFANLSDAQLLQLAQAIVAEIKLRVADKGFPYLSLSGFVNRELSTGAFGLCGVLQAAIDKSGINAKFDDSFVQLDSSHLQSSVGEFPEPSNINDAGDGSRSTATAASAQLIAGDLLQSISSTLSARSDTFRIRTYGETRNPVSDEVGGRAWCEAIVQRLPEPVSPGAGSADEADYWEPAANDKMGRRFKIIRLRWLRPDEV